MPVHEAMATKAQTLRMATVMGIRSCSCNEGGHSDYRASQDRAIQAKSRCASQATTKYSRLLNVKEVIFVSIMLYHASPDLESGRHAGWGVGGKDSRGLSTE